MSATCPRCGVEVHAIIKLASLEVPVPIEDAITVVVAGDDGPRAITAWPRHVCSTVQDNGKRAGEGI